MGTLTANQPRLADYCEHKLPTSCRLSSIPQCCACADERAHAPSYSTYIDGIGFVPRGNRWQRYCWFCKEFWETRVRASGLLPSHTRIPAHPDQREFLERWYEFHRGYRIFAAPDGTEEREAVLGEDFRDVAPGCLPRTLEELRAGQLQSGLAEREARLREENARAQPETVVEGPSLDEELDQLFQAAETEERDGQAAARVSRRVEPPPPLPPAARANVHAQAMSAAGTRDIEFQARRVAALRRELHRMRRGMERVIEGLRSFGEEVLDPTEATSALTELEHTIEGMSGPGLGDRAERALESVNRLTGSVGPELSQRDRTLADMQARVEQARSHVNTTRANRDAAALTLSQAEEEFQASQSRLRQLLHEHRTTENYMRLFGSREEMIAQGDNYESPIGGMFNRAWERYQAVEEVRREEQTLRQVLEDEALITGPGGAEIIRRLNELGATERDVWGVPRRSQPGNTPVHPTSAVDMSQTSREHGDVPQPDPELRHTDPPQEYHGLLQRQDQHEDASELHSDPARSTRTPAESLTGDVGSTQDAFNVTASTSRVAGPPGETLDDDPTINNDQGLDALYVLRRISADATLRDRMIYPVTAPEITQLTLAVEGNTLDASDVQHLRAFLDHSTELLWTCGLPEERNRRRRQRGEEVAFSANAHDLTRQRVLIMHDIEVMAECFQMSATVRRRSGIPAPAQLRMLYRLQRGERMANDRAVLLEMLQDEQTLALAKDVQAQVVGQQSEVASMQQEQLERSRQEDARNGDHSRTELDAQRRATRAFAVAAGRVAMQTGPSTLYRRMLDRFEDQNGIYERAMQVNDDGTPVSEFRRLSLDEYLGPPSTADRANLQAVPSALHRRMVDRGIYERREQIDGNGARATQYRRLFVDDFMVPPLAATDPVSDSDTDEEARGLDAADTGRPTEPKSDEEMTVKLDCRICYTQLADIACLPCGHLVMCKWCSEQHSPVMAHDRTRPRHPASCPVCRKGIKQKVRVFRA